MSDETFIVPTASLKIEGDEVVLRYRPEPMPADPVKSTRQLLEALLAQMGKPTPPEGETP